jgi:hypothetical protein
MNGKAWGKTVNISVSVKTRRPSQHTETFEEDEVNAFFHFALILSTALGTGVHSASNRNEYQKQ